MKIKNGFIVKEIAGQCVVVALGEASKIFNGIIKLNDSARFIWEKIVAGLDREAIVSAMVEEYEGLDVATAEKDFDNFTDKLRSANILE